MGKTSITSTSFIFLSVSDRRLTKATRHNSHNSKRRTERRRPGLCRNRPLIWPKQSGDLFIYFAHLHHQINVAATTAEQSRGLEIGIARRRHWFRHDRRRHPEHGGPARGAPGRPHREDRRRSAPGRCCRRCRCGFGGIRPSATSGAGWNRTAASRCCCAAAGRGCRAGRGRCHRHVLDVRSDRAASVHCCRAARSSVCICVCFGICIHIKRVEGIGRPAQR